MDVVSYRGPGVAGGVSSGVGSAWKGQAATDSKWWFLNKRNLETLSADAGESTFISLLPESLVKGHYGFCNEFLWPLMHDLPQYATYSEEQHAQYIAFNKLVTNQINMLVPATQDFFIQDYQLGLAPKCLALKGHRAIIFWHIPWPKHVSLNYSAPIRELARGLLGASSLGFHTQEYANNFLDFVKHHLPEYKINWADMTVELTDEGLHNSRRRGMQVVQRCNASVQNTRERSLSTKAVTVSGRSSSKVTKLRVHPLGIDVPYWTELKELSLSMNLEPELKELAKSTYVLSVDRVDYTKSVLDRFHIIDRFFEAHPEWLSTLSFVQVCGRSRSGLPAFDQYWSSCRLVAEAVNNKWQKDGWQPINWIERSLSNKELAFLYAHADSMLVNPVRDGLNLTAKEFVACQGEQTGVLLLSSGAGAIHELGGHTLNSSPHDYACTIELLAHSLQMPLKERQERMLAMRTILLANQLFHWWSAFIDENTQSKQFGKNIETIKEKVS